MAADVNANIGVNIETSDALNQLKNLQRQISNFHTSVAKSSASAAAAQKALQTNFINSVNAIGQFSAELKTVRTTAETFTNSLEKNKFSMGEYFRYAAANTKMFGKRFATEMGIIEKTATERVKTLQTQYVKLGRNAQGAMEAIAIRPTVLDMQDLGTQTQIAAQKQAIFNQLVRQGSTNLLNFGKNTQWAGRQLMVGFTLPLITLGTVATKTFMDMEQQVIKFRKVYGDLFTPEAERQQALEDIQELAKAFTQYGVAASDVVGIAADAAAAGFAGVDLQKQTEQSIRLSILGQLDYQKSLETTISLQNAFRISSDQLAEAIDFLNAVENQTVVSLDDVTTAIPKVAPVIQSLGGDVKDLAFFLAAMKEGGVNASEGANALKSGLASLINPTEKAAQFLGAMGINIRQIVTENQGKLRETVLDFALALDKLDPLQRAQAIEQLFGKFQFARISTLFDNVIRDGNQASRVLDLATASVEELAGMSEKELGMTAESAMNKFLKVVEDLKIALVPIGEVFLETVTPFVESLGKIVSAFNELPNEVKRAITLVVTLVGGLGPVALMTFGLIANGIANSIKFIALLRNGFLRLTGQSNSLRESTEYMTQEQLEAAAAAMSLDQAHANLIQRFTVEKGAVDKLRDAYMQAVAAGAKFAQINPGMMLPGFKKPQGFANGGLIQGPGTGRSDSIPAMVSNGEFIVSAKRTKQYLPLLQAIAAGEVPGYASVNTGGSLVGGSSDEQVNKIISEARNVANGIEGVADLLTEKLRQLSQDISPSKLRQELASDPVLQLLSSSTKAKGRSTGSSGLVKMHMGGSGVGVNNVSDISGILTPAQRRALSAPDVSNVRMLNNLVFGGPAAANRGQLSGREFGSFVTQNPTAFMGQLAKQGRVDPNNPDLMRFAENVARQFALAGDRAIGESEFQSIIERAMAEEIDDISRNTSAEIRQLFDEARKASTVAYTAQNAAGERVAYRMNLPVSARGQSVNVGGSNVDISSQRPYRGVSISQQGMEQSDAFTEQVIRERAIASGRIAGTVFAEAAGEALEQAAQVNSPSKRTVNATEGMVQGVEQGLLNGVDDAKAAGEQVSRAFTQSSRRASSGGVIKFDEKSGKYMSEEKYNKQMAARQEAQLRIIGMNTRSFTGLLDKTQKLSFGMSAVAGVMSMFGGGVGEAAGIIFQLTSAMFGLVTLTELLIKTKRGEALASAFATNVSKRAAAVQASMGLAGGSLFTKGGGIAGLFKNLANGLGFVLRFLGPVGIGLSALAIGIPFIVNIINKQKEKVEGLGNAARFTAGQLENLAGKFNVELKQSSIGMGFKESTRGATTEQAQEAVRLSQDQEFLDQFKLPISAIENASQEAAQAALEALNIQLQASGFGPEAAHTILMGIAEAAKRTDLNLSFAKIDIDFTSPQFKEQANTAAKTAVQTIKNAITANGAGLGEALQSGGSTIANILEALNIGLQTGEISAAQFNEQLGDITTLLSNFEYPALLDDIIKKLNLTDALANVKEYKNLLALIAAEVAGVDTAKYVGAFEISEDPNASAEERRQAQIGMNALAAATKKAAGQTEELRLENEANAEQTQQNILLEQELQDARAGIEKNLEDIRNSISTYEILIAQGWNAEEAYAAASNNALAFSIALAAVDGVASGMSLDEAIAQAREFIDTTKAFENLNPNRSGGSGKKSIYAQATEDLQEQIKSIKQTNIAFKKLRNEGFSVAQAFAAAKDPILAAALASTKVDSTKWKALVKLIRDAAEASIKSFDGQRQAFLNLKSQAEEYFAILEDEVNLKYADTIRKQTKEVEKLQDAVNAVNEEIKDYQDQISAIQRSIEIEFDRPIAALQEESSDLSNDLTLIDKAADEITKRYDEQSKALEQVRKVNEQILNQQKQQQGLAAALSAGDVAAAASMIQDIRSANAEAAAVSQQDMLGAARDAEIGALRSASGMSREQIEERQFQINQQIYRLEEQKEVKLKQIQGIEDQIYTIQQNKLVPLEKALKIAQDTLTETEKQRDIELEAIDLKRQSWEEAELALDKARIKAGEFNGVVDITKTLMKDTAKGAKDLKSYWDSLKDKVITITIRTVREEVAATTKTKNKSSGGIIRLAAGGMVPKYLAGGGSPWPSMGSDIVPAMLTPGEFVVNRSATQKFKPLLSAINSSKGNIIPRLSAPNTNGYAPRTFNQSVYQMPDRSYPGPQNSGPIYSSSIKGNDSVPTEVNNSVYNYSLSVNVDGSNLSANDIANVVMSKLKRVESQKLRNQVIR